MSDVPKPQAHQRTHEAVIRLVREALPPGAVVLDAGCGQGALTVRLLDEAYVVLGADINPSRLKRRGTPAIAADLERGLPCADGVFDAVVAVELLEHLQRWPDFLLEARRVLKPGGLLLITVPNILNLASRFRYLVCGYPSLYSRVRLGFGAEHRHIALIPAQILACLAQRSGFRLLALSTDRFRRSSLVFAPAVPFFLAATRLFLAKAYDPLLWRAPILFGRTLVALFEKPPTGPDARPPAA